MGMGGSARPGSSKSEPLRTNRIVSIMYVLVDLDEPLSRASRAHPKTNKHAYLTHLDRLVLVEITRWHSECARQTNPPLEPVTREALEARVAEERR
jgi:hypothetical protein